RNAIERAVILATGPEIVPADLPESVATAGVAGPEVALGALVTLDAIEQVHIRLVTGRTSTLEEAARVLGVDAATIYRKRKRWAAAAEAAAMQSA
ncbi:MAG TPA: hypothetical protein VFJ90_14365, partial [Candidatus Didemnitutus sp.]|nr:hypothetical protein [Candidatus Didemnitutus sp.]